MKLFPFQTEGAAWLSARRRALLADEQGLGKTVQAIAAADNAGHWNVLVVCKAVAKTNWMREFDQWSFADRRVQIPGTTDKFDPRAELTILNYDIVHRPGVLRQLVRGRWDLLIADEMHSVKGGLDTKRGQVLLHDQLGLAGRCNAVWGLSGTPAPNHAGDLYAWLSAVHPEAVVDLPNYHDFLNRYCRWINTDRGPRIFGNKKGAAAELRRLLAPIMLRRKRTEVLPQLPDLSVDMLPVDSRVSPELKALERHPDVAAVRDVLLAIEVDDNPDAWERIAELDLGTYRRFTGLAKIEAVAELVRDELSAGQDKIVLMAWHRDVIDKLTDLLSDYGAMSIHGGTPFAEKQFAIDSFQRQSTGCRVIVGNIQTAGTSITLTAANRLLFVESSYVPGDNEQAMLRILRIGQTRACRVSFTALAGTTDEIVQRVYARKAQMLSEFID